VKKIIITGATSFLGRNVINGLLKDDCLIYALCRPNSSSVEILPENEKLNIVYGSLADMETVLVADIKKADVFIHFAWDGSGRQGRADEIVQNKNAEYAVKALGIAKKLGCNKFIFPGSQAEYGIRQDIMRETDICKPVSAYGKAKLLFQELAEKENNLKDITLIHLRIFSVYGFGDRTGTLVDSCINTFNSGNKIELGPCKQYWNFLYIDDFVYVIRKFVEENVCGGVYNIASDDTRILRAFVDEIWKLSNKSGRYIYGSDSFNPEGVPNLKPDISELLGVIGKSYSFTSFEQGITGIMRKKGIN
jgi:nucleoside-diphosphate-sugar epimerase